MFPDRCPRDLQGAAQFLAGNYPPLIFPEDIQYPLIQRSAAVLRVPGEMVLQLTSSSIEISIARAEWVRAPTEMISTPVAAISRTVSRFTPPEASISALPAIMATASRMVA